MEFVDERFELQKTVQLSGDSSYILAQTKEGRLALVLQAARVTGEALTRYCVDHEACLANMNVLDKKGRNLLIVYDLTGMGMFNWHSVLQPLVEMKKRLRVAYDRHLLCTIVVVSDAATRDALNVIFSSIFEATRPLRVMCKDEDVAALVATLWIPRR